MNLDNTFAFQNYVFPEYYKLITGIDNEGNLELDEDDKINYKYLDDLTSYNHHTYLENYNSLFSEAADYSDESKQSYFLRFYRNLGKTYYNKLYENKSKYTYEKIIEQTEKFADNCMDFKNKIIDDCQGEWFEMAVSILGCLNKTVGFTNINSSNKWRQNLENTGSGFNDTKDQCQLIIGDSTRRKSTTSDKYAICSFCGVQFEPIQNKLQISCEHVLEIGLLTFLIGLTPSLINNGELDEDHEEELIEFFKNFHCYKWACQRCNTIKSNIQASTNLVKKGHGDFKSTIFVGFNENSGFEVNHAVLEEFCNRVIDNNIHTKYINKNKALKGRIDELKKTNNYNDFYDHMDKDVVQPLVDALNERLELFYGDTNAEKLAFMFSLGLIRWSILDINSYAGPIVSGGGENEQLFLNSLVSSKFTTNNELFNFINTIIYHNDVNEKLTYMLDNFDDFSYAFNLFLQNISNNFDLLFGLLNNINSIKSLIDSKDNTTNKFQQYLEVKMKQFNETSSELIKSLCIYSNYETIISVLHLYFTHPAGENLLNGFNQGLISSGANGTQILKNLFDKYQESVQLIEKADFNIAGDDYKNSFIVYKFDEYLFILNTNMITLSRLMDKPKLNSKQTDTKMNIDKDNEFGVTNNVLVTVLYSTNQQLQPGMNITLTPLEKDTATNFNIKDVCLKICPGELINLNIDAKQNITLSIHGGKNKKKKTYNKNNKKKPIKKIKTVKKPIKKNKTCKKK